MTIPLRQLAFWNLCQGPGAFFLTLAISKPCLRPPARCTTSKDLAKASEFWSMLTGLKIFEMIRAGATVKTYIENHWRLGLNTSEFFRKSQHLWSDSLTPIQIPAKCCQYGHVSTIWNPLHSVALHCTHFFARLDFLQFARKKQVTKLNKSRLCSKPDQTFWQLTLAQSHAENRWTLRWAAMDGKKVLAAAVAPWFDRPRK